MTDSLDIAEVARRTGLTSRALRFYEGRGLVRPLRTASGRRHYGPAELERLHQIIALKRAGLPLGDIKRLFDRKPIDLRALLGTQHEVLAAQARDTAVALSLVTTALSRIDRGESLDAATLCSLIQQGNKTMRNDHDAWKTVTDRYLSEEAKADFAATLPQMGTAFSGAEMAQKWKELGSRIKAALPLDPASETAHGFLREWQALLAPFMQVATPAMREGSRAMYEDIENWQGQADPGFDAEVFRFIQAAQRTAQA